MVWFGGVDPGKTGAIAIIKDGQAHVLEYSFEDNEAGQSKEVRRLISRANISPNEYYEGIVCVEKQQTASGRTSSFSIGKNYGQWLMLLTCLKIPFKVISARKWQSEILGGGVRGRDKLKQKSVSVASKLYPDIELTGPRGGVKDGIADAINIATYAKKVYSK